MKNQWKEGKEVNFFEKDFFNQFTIFKVIKIDLMLWVHSI